MTARTFYAASLGDRQVTVFTTRRQPRFRALREVDILDARLSAARDFGRSKPETQSTRSSHMSPRRQPIDRSRGIFEVDWQLFGELSRALALKVARGYDQELVVGIATAGVIPGATIAAILGREFHSIVVSRRIGSERVRATPAVLGAAPAEVRGRRVLIVDETCDSGDTLRLAVASVVNAGASDVRTAVGFQTGGYAADFSALETESVIILPWDREILKDGNLVLRPEYAEVLGE